jgi:hypothetical protein
MRIRRVVDRLGFRLASSRVALVDHADGYRLSPLTIAGDDGDEWLPAPSQRRVQFLLGPSCTREDAARADDREVRIDGADNVSSRW